MRFPLIFVFQLLLVLGFTSCGPTVIYEENHQVGNGGWRYSDTLSFAYEIVDTTQAYDLEIEVDHADNFAYENFYLKIHTNLPNGRRTTERISLDLAGDYGAWNGDCSGGVCQFSIPILFNTRFQTPGRYGITLEQNSRDEPLAGILGMGLKLQEAVK